MTNFKGTKGRWYRYRKTDNHIVEAVLSDNDDVICSLLHNSHEIEYNALLISKSPELLEMLERITTQGFTEGSIDLGLMAEAKQLIKEATEL
jgi:hypothetical protein